ncbi:MAG: MarR family winged helix-turn-helix transcriptional regulator [Bacteroidota bacterium]
MKLEDEVRSRKFSSEAQKAHVNILFTSAWLNNQVMYLFKPYGLSTQQYNILRILKGQYPNAAPLKLLTERMIDKMSNTSRLVEKLSQKKLVDRKTCKESRRQVDITLTEKGFKLVEELNEKVDKYHKSINVLTNEEAKQLNDLLDKLRG